MSIFHVIDNRPNSEVLEGPRVSATALWEANDPLTAGNAALNALGHPAGWNRGFVVCKSNEFARWIIVNINTGQIHRYK